MAPHHVKRDVLLMKSAVYAMKRALYVYFMKRVCHALHLTQRTLLVATALLQECAAAARVTG